MNKAKRKLQLTGAIISIIIGAVSIVFGIVLMALIGSADLGTIDPEMSKLAEDGVKGILYAGIILSMIFSAALIICGSLMCPNPDKKNTEYKGLTITLLVLNSLMLLSSCLSFTGAGSVIDIILCLATVGVLIAALCIKDNGVQAPAGETANVQNGQSASQPVKNESAQQTNNGKIDSIRKLHEEGVISEEEMKKLIVKELEK